MLALLLPLLFAHPCPTFQEHADEIGERIAALREEAAVAESEGQLAQAEALLREGRDLAYDHERSTARVDHALGRVLYRLGQGEEGLALLYAANQERPGDVSIVLDLVDVLIAQRDFALGNGEPYSADSALQQAEEVLAPHLSEHGEDPEVKLRHARILTRKRDAEKEAVPLYMQLLRRNPDDPALNTEFVKAVGNAGLFERALGFYEGLDMERSLRLWYTGEVYAARGHYNFNRFLDDQEAIDSYHDAERYILEAGRLNPDWYDSASQNAAFHRAWAGWVLIRAGELTEAWEHFRSALGRLPGCSSAIEGMNYLGAKYLEERELEKACELYRQLCIHAPDRADFWNNYGLLCRDVERHEESLTAYRKAMELSPQDPRVINDAAMMLQYYLKRDLDQAERWLLQAREIARWNWESAQDEAYAADQLAVYGDSLVNLWRLYDDQGRMEEASAMRAEMREADPGRPELPPLPPDADDDGVEVEDRASDDGREGASA